MGMKLALAVVTAVLASAGSMVAMFAALLAGSGTLLALAGALVAVVVAGLYGAFKVVN